MPTDPLAPYAARIGELLRLETWLDQPGLTVDIIRAHVAGRIEALYPLDYHVYRNRWQKAGDGAPGPLLSFLEWYPLFTELTELGEAAAILETEESGKIGEIRKLLLLSRAV